MDIKEAIEQFRSEKNDPQKPAHFIYGLLSTAHPTIVEMIEYQAARLIVSGEKMQSGMSEVLSTEEGKQEVERRLDELLVKYNTPGFNSPDDTEDDDD